jgi:hypothetical protein
MHHEALEEVETWRSAFGKIAGIVCGVAVFLVFGSYYFVRPAPGWLCDSTQGHAI